MSSSEENFDLDNVSGSELESDDYVPIKKTKVVAKQPAKVASKASKATLSKPKAQKKKPLTDLDENADDKDEDEFIASMPRADRKEKTVDERFQKLTQVEHVLKRPDSYIGSVETITQQLWVYDSENQRMEYRDVKYVPGFFKIFDEILVNAADNKINDPDMDTIKVDIDVENRTISVFNNGSGIPIEIHKATQLYVPELIFGHLLSSSNYDDNEKKLTGGRNGYGAKLTNIYSLEFSVETADKSTGQKYKQAWNDNMSKVSKAKITKNPRNEEYTKVTFQPDLGRFGMDSIDSDTMALLKKRVYDIAGTVKNIKVYLNGDRLKVKGFKSYVEMFVNSAAADAAKQSGGAAQAKPTIVHEVLGPRWEVAFAVSEGSFQQVSFANSIATTKGGTHVNVITDQIAKNLVASVTKKNKGATVKTAQIRNHMWIFVNALIENPTFDSQTKETLTLPTAKFGTKPVVSEDFMKKVSKTAIVDNVLSWAKFKADQEIKKTDGSKRNRLAGLTKLCDANNAGTRYANQCTLILTEGDSAKSLAVAGLGVVGRDNFGVFPLRGKPLNVREAKHEQIMKNEEIQNVKKILGLQHNKVYNDVSSLRYGKLMIMTDQDHDGSHIKGLLINFLDHFYPSLLKIPNFLVEFVTPIVRVTKGKKIKDFFTIPEYEEWLEAQPDKHKWDSKYYKGLGTSKDEDGRYYFSNMKTHVIPFATAQEGDKRLIELAFSKKKADDRKEWLRQFKPGTFLNHNTDEIPLSDFINKELILFSMADNIRSIPSIADGLKPGQRKVIWACFKRNLKKEIKVAQLVGFVSEKAAYHHGEASLTQTIVNLAQDYVGSNNLNLLLPNGQYGTRHEGGKDHASARYIFTEPSILARSVFHIADDPILNFLKEDNQWIEPEWYLPVLPLILINGAEGIGTGWSTTIPCYNPSDIVRNIRRLMDGQEQEPMLPWWRGFNGSIKKTGDNKYDVAGTARKIDDTTIEITELPIHKWTVTFKGELENMISGEKSEGFVKDYKEHSENVNVHFIVTMSAKGMQKAEEQGFTEFFKLFTRVNTSNMICFDFDGKIKRYSTPEEILEEFYNKRLIYYQKRKDHMAAELQNQLDKLNNQARFIKMIVDKEITVANRKKADIVVELRKKGFRPFPKVAVGEATREDEAVSGSGDEEENEGSASDYDYLLGMPIWSLTREKIEKLLQQAQGKESELLELLERTPMQIWNQDLDKFLAQWENYCREWDAKSTKDATGKSIKRKQKTLQHRKSLPGRGGDSDDDFQPTKVISRMKEKPRAKPAKAKHVDDDSSLPPTLPSKRPAKKLEDKDSESDLEFFIKPAPKKPISKPEDSGSDVEVIPRLAAKGKAKERVVPVPKRKSLDKADNADDSDEFNLKPTKKTKTQIHDFFDKVPVANKKAPVRTASSSKKPAPKAKVADSDEEEEGRAASPIPARTTNQRATRGVTKKYVESDSDEEGSDGSVFEED